MISYPIPSTLLVIPHFPDPCICLKALDPRIHNTELWIRNPTFFKFLCECSEKIHVISEGQVASRRYTTLKGQ
jgi:hypothetical protein